ncbi:MAG: trypsin-like peptidase domain-containing protein [Phycisphaerales bacterium]
MRGAISYGPGLVVLGAAAAALFVVPTTVRQFVHAQTTADVIRASNRLTAPGNVLEEINAVQRDIAKAVEPSVVHVSTTGYVSRQAMKQAFVSSGSGWVFDDQGHIVTNAHVVDGADRMEVQLHDGELREAELVGRDIRTDIAVLKIAPGELHPAQRGNSDDLEQGDMVYAFGSPFDFRFSMSSGIVSGLGRTAGPEEIDYQNFIQVDAAINPGNSGGPLTDVHGKVVGMNTAIATGRGNTVGQGQFAGIGLAIPMSMIENVVSQLIESGEVKKGFLGVRVESPDDRALASLDDPALKFVAERFKGEGAVIASVDAKSPAANAGLRVGDVLVAVDGRKITGSAQVPAIISSKRPGTPVELELWRPNVGEGSSKKEVVKVTLSELDPGDRAPGITQALKRLGFDKLATATEQRCRELDVPYRRGVLVEEVEPNSDLARYVPAGSVLVEVLGQPIGSEDELYARLVNYLLNLQRHRAPADPFLRVPITVVPPKGEATQVYLPLRP